MKTVKDYHGSKLINENRRKKAAEKRKGMSNSTRKLFLHVQDFVDAYVGPFETEEAARAHFAWVADTLHASAVLIDIVEVLPENAFVLTPEQDKQEIK